MVHTCWNKYNWAKSFHIYICVFPFVWHAVNLQCITLESVGWRKSSSWIVFAFAKQTHLGAFVILIEDNVCILTNYSMPSFYLHIFLCHFSLSIHSTLSILHSSIGFVLYLNELESGTRIYLPKYWLLIQNEEEIRWTNAFMVFKFTLHLVAIGLFPILHTTVVHVWILDSI